MVLRLQYTNCVLWRQWIGSVAAMLMMLVLGLAVGWASPYLAQFTSGDSPFPATASEISWIASIPQLGRIPGAILGAVCVQYLGSKTVMIGTGFSLVISWSLVIFANSVSWLYVSTFISGASSEVACVSYPLYLADVSCSKIRGALVILAGNGLVMGILTGNAIGHHVSMKVFACIALVPTICFLLIFLWIPHSPYYLTSKGKVQDAERSIQKFNPKANVQTEMESIRKFLALSNSSTLADILREFNVPKNRKTGVIIVALTMFQQFSGINPMIAHMESIMTRAKMTVIAPSTVPLIGHGVGIITGWVSMYTTEEFGRKKMWVISSAGICGAMAALGTHFYLIGKGFDPAKLQWLPIVSTISLEFFFTIGIACVPVILFSELFASNIRALVGCIISVFSGVFGFLAIYGYQSLTDHIDEAYVWWIHGILMVVSLIFGLMAIPETQGRTLLEIQDVLVETRKGEVD